VRFPRLPIVTNLVPQLVAMLLVILVASEIFTNALEHLGDKLKISEGVTGSLFAAVGTALPERIGLPTNLATILLQLAIGLGLLVLGAKGFIHGIEGVSQVLGISALLLSLLIIPIATELPEKVNSILWIRRGKDTLVFGNITGAMVFQGTLLPAIGIMLTPWQPRIEVLTGVLVTLVAAAWLRVNIRAAGLAVWALLINGGLYCAYLAITLAR
jgi:cation:H+ antiporter